MNALLPKLRQTAVVAMVTVALLAAIEAGLHFLFPDSGNEYVFHPKYLFALSPNKTHEFQRAAINGGQKIQYHVNSLGYRGRETSPRADGLRIMVYGDSNIQARFSELKSTFPKQLGAFLENSIGAEIEVLNMGVTGYSPAQYVLQLQNEIHVWCPDAMVVHLFADNDFGDLLRNKLFRISENGQLVHNTKAADLRKLFLQEQESKISQLITKTQMYHVANNVANYVLARVNRILARVNRSLGRSKTARPSADKLIEENIGKNLTLLQEQYASYVQNDKVEHLTLVLYDFDLALEPSRESSRTKRDLMENLLEKIADLSTQYSVPVVFLLQPSVRDVSTNMSPNFTDFVEFSDEYRRSYLTGLLEGLLREVVFKGHNQISYVNLFRYFRSDGESPYYFKGGNDHWNDAGQRLAAELVAEHIVERHMKSITDKGSECRGGQ